MAEQAEREEYHRLLYVAMTRAEDRLYICGWEGSQKREAGVVWYDLVRDGLGGLLGPCERQRETSEGWRALRRRRRRATSTSLRSGAISARSRLGAHAGAAGARTAQADAVAPHAAA